MRLCIPVVVVSALALPGAAALAQDKSAPPTQKDSLSVERMVPKDATLDLRTAVRNLRQASVILLDQKQPGPKRQKAFNDAQDAIKKAEVAMANLPPSMQTAIEHKAKEWPVVAARLDRAAAALETAVDNLSSKTGAQQKQAVQSAQAALEDVRDAVKDLPNWNVGANESSGSAASVGSNDTVGSTKK